MLEQAGTVRKKKTRVCHEAATAKNFKLLYVKVSFHLHNSLSRQTISIPILHVGAPELREMGDLL